MYEERRKELREVESAIDIEVFDAVEVDFAPTAEDEIRAFLDEADFDYAIGSVHYLDGVHTSKHGAFADRDDVDELLDQYYDDLVALIESDLFDVVAHVDVFRRTPELRGYDDEFQFERVAAALDDSRTIPEINAGRADRECGTVHPAPEFYEVLAGCDVSFALGTDSHRPDEIVPRVDHLREFVAETAVDPALIHR